MYYSDHAPPHFHALYSGFEAIVKIDDGELLRGSLPRTALKLVRLWLEVDGVRLKLMENWESRLRNDGQRIFAIEGLE